jgi:hypothetical protein
MSHDLGNGQDPRLALNLNTRPFCAPRHQPATSARSARSDRPGNHTGPHRGGRFDFEGGELPVRLRQGLDASGGYDTPRPDGIDLKPPGRVDGDGVGGVGGDATDDV